MSIQRKIAEGPADQADTPSVAGPGPARPRRKRRRGRRTVRLAAFLVVVLTLPILFLAVTGTRITAPEWLGQRIEAELNARMADGGRLSIGPISMQIDTRLRPGVEFRDVGVYDRNGIEIGQLNRISARLEPAQLLRGNAGIGVVTVAGAQITVRRRVDGTFDLSVGSGIGASGSLANVLGALDRAFAQEPLTQLRQVRAEELTITLEDARSGRIWQVTGGTILLSHREDRLDLTISADVFNGTEELASTVIGFRIAKGSSRASLTATFENALSADIAAQSPVLSFLSVLDAPISGALRTTFDEDGQIEDLAGTLSVGPGALKPDEDTPPILFEYGQAYMDYDPVDQALSFTEVAFESETASVAADGIALLRDFDDRWPQSLVGQFRISNMRLQPQNIFAEPMTFDRGAFDFRLKLDPFSVDIGQVSLGPPDQRLLVRGRIRTDKDGWRAALDLELNRMALENIIAKWPVSVARGAREWVAANVRTGDVTGMTGALRLATGARPLVSLSFQFKDAVIQALKFLPPIKGAAGYASLVDNGFTLVVEKGHVTAPQGGDVKIAGSVFRIAQLTNGGVDRAEVTLTTDSTVTAALSLLNQEPLSIMDKAGMEVDVAEGHAEATARLAFDLVKGLKFEDVDYAAEGTISDLRSDKLVKGRVLTADRVSFRADPSGMEISGDARLDGLAISGTWSQKFGADHRGTSRVEGTVELSPAFLDAFNIGLPEGSLSGRGVAQVTLDLVEGQAPKFVLTSDLNRVALNLRALGWSKPRNRTGTLEVAGRLGEVPSIDRLVFRAPGLSASGVIDLGPGGSLKQAQFDRVRVGDWLDGPVTLIGRGPNRPPAVVIEGGQVDLRSAELGSSGSGSEGGPLTMRLARLIVSDGIELHDFRGKFEPGRGLNGQFTASVNGAAPIRGTVVNTPAGAAIRIISDDAGRTLAAAGILRNVRGGSMDLTLNPSGRAGIYNGRLSIRNTRIVEAPALTELLNAISIVGLLNQLKAGGIHLSDVEAEFQLHPDRLVLLRSSAVGPSLGISLDGTYSMTRDRLDMQGVISPVYFLNGIGQIFSRGREGLFGFSFRLRGEAQNPRVSVNPLSILTPGMFREIFRRPPPTRTQ